MPAHRPAMRSESRVRRRQSPACCRARRWSPPRDPASARAAKAGLDLHVQVKADVRARRSGQRLLLAPARLRARRWSPAPRPSARCPVRRLHWRPRRGLDIEQRWAPCCPHRAVDGFVECRHAEPLSPSLHQRLRHLACAVTVGVGLDDGKAGTPAVSWISRRLSASASTSISSQASRGSGDMPASRRRSSIGARVVEDSLIAA